MTTNTTSRNATITLKGNSEKELADKEASLKILAESLTRDSLVILANKSRKPGANEKIKFYEKWM